MDKKTIENVIRRYLERHGLKALLVKLSAHNASPFSEANSGELGILHEKIVRLQQRIEESKTAGSNDKDLAKLTASLEELRVTSSEIRSIQEHYTLVHYEVHAFICKLQGLVQVISNLDFVWSCFHTLKCFELSGVGLSPLRNRCQYSTEWTTSRLHPLRNTGNFGGSHVLPASVESTI